MKFPLIMYLPSFAISSTIVVLLTLQHDVQAQHHWVNGTSQIQFVTDDVCTQGVSQLPQPNDPLAGNNQYMGQPAQYGEQMILDQFGQPLVFIVDGSIYDREGYLIADSELSSPNCVVCLPHSITDVLAIPVPGECYKYIITFSVMASGNSPAQLLVAVLDLAMENPYFLNTSTNGFPNTPMAGRRGAIVEGAVISNFTWPSGSQTPSSGSSYILGIAMPPPTISGGHYLAAQQELLDIGHDLDKWLFFIGHRSLNRYKISTQGMTHQGDQSTTVPFATINGELEYERIPYGEIETVLNNNEIVVAMSARAIVQFPPIPIDYWRQYLILHHYSLSGSFLSYDLILLDEYMYHENIDPDAHLWSSTGGVEFSPDGQSVYIMKTHAPHLGVVDIATQTYSDLAINAADWRYSQLESAPSSIDNAQTSIYAINSSGTLAELRNVNDPSTVVWDPAVYQLPTTYNNLSVQEAAIITTYTDQLPLFTLQNNPQHSDPYGPNVALDCCDAMVQAEGWTKENLTSDTWNLGDNPFNNTCKPILWKDDLVIPSGIHITANDLTFQFGPEVAMIIQPDAAFTCNNCLLTSACTEERWEGILVQGDPQEHQFGGQYPDHQGYLSLQQNTILEHADVGVFVSNTGMGNPSGGMVVMNNATVRDCPIGVEFLAYQNFNPGTNASARNRSRFSETTFIADWDFIGNKQLNAHVRLWGVDGIYFNQCSFKNIWLDGDVNGSEQLGYGIYSLDANYRVNPGCAVTIPFGSECPNADVLPSEFQGLDHGIHALSSSTPRRVFVDRAEFTANICGVYAGGLSGLTVKRSDFFLGARNVALTNQFEDNWQGHHRGIYTYESHNFRIYDNEFTGSVGPPTPAPTEGIVVGYSRDHNDKVFRNTGTNLTAGFVGEGICADLTPSYPPIVGLQLLCNENTNNHTNLWSRKIDGAADDDLHIIRTNQGWDIHPADNRFDQWLWSPDPNDPIDYDVTTSYANISYHYRAQGNLEPESWPSNNFLAPITAASNPNEICPDWIALDPMGNDAQRRSQLIQGFETSKLAYVTSRYQWEQLLDGGNTDALVLQVQSTWPEEAWDLRNTLLAESPYLSQEVLITTVKDNILPTAMLTEVLTANPDATQEGFIEWMQYESGYPQPQYVLDQIMASWSQDTYRSTLEAQMGGHHAEMTHALNMHLELLASDTVGDPTDSIAYHWRRLPTRAALYTRALALMQQGDFTIAHSEVANYVLHERAPEPDVLERDRMLDLIDLYSEWHVENKDVTQLEPVDISALEAIANGRYDRPAEWAANLLCYGYGMCRPPLTGGLPGERSLLSPFLHEEVPQGPSLTLHPNPGTNWSAVSYNLEAAPDKAEVRMSDLSGREVQHLPLSMQEGQVILDLREIPAGVYTVQLLNDKASVRTERLIVK